MVALKLLVISFVAPFVTAAGSVLSPVPALKLLMFALVHRFAPVMRSAAPTTIVTRVVASPASGVAITITAAAGVAAVMVAVAVISTAVTVGALIVLIAVTIPGTVVICASRSGDGYGQGQHGKCPE